MRHVIRSVVESWERRTHWRTLSPSRRNIVVIIHRFPNVLMRKSLAFTFTDLALSFLFETMVLLTSLRLERTYVLYVYFFIC